LERNELICIEKRTKCLTQSVLPDISTHIFCHVSKFVS